MHCANIIISQRNKISWHTQFSLKMESISKPYGKEKNEQTEKLNSKTRMFCFVWAIDSGKKHEIKCIFVSSVFLVSLPLRTNWRMHCNDSKAVDHSIEFKLTLCTTSTCILWIKHSYTVCECWVHKERKRNERRSVRTHMQHERR